MPLGRSGLGLDALANDLGIERQEAHDALADVRIVSEALRQVKRTVASDWARATSIWSGCAVGQPKQPKPGY